MGKANAVGGCFILRGYVGISWDIYADLCLRLGTDRIRVELGGILGLQGDSISCLASGWALIGFGV